MDEYYKFMYLSRTKGLLILLAYYLQSNSAINDSFWYNLPTIKDRF